MSSYLRIYLNQNKYNYLVFVLFCLITFSYNFLFQIPLEITIYWIIILLFLFLTYSLIDYFIKKKQYQNLIFISKLEFEELFDKLKLFKFSNSNVQELIKIIDHYNSELIQLKNKSLTENKETSEYILTWIHQIKLPITSIRLLLEDEDNSLAREIKSELFRIELYVEMILTYFRLQSPSTDYLFESLDLKQIIQEEIKKFSSEFIKRGISLELEMEQEYIISDEKWFSFILDQILSNALKYTYSGKIKVSLIDNNLKISDTGIGIAQSDLPRIFERGFTGYNGRSDKRASGLGLYLTKQICDNLKIPVSLKSVLNKGTTVSLDLRGIKKENNYLYD